MTSTISAVPRSAWPGSLRMVVLCGGTIVALSGGMRQVTALYMPPVTQSLGVSIAAFSTALAIASLMWGVSSVVAGALADRYGVARVGAAGIVLMALGYLAMYAAAGSADLTWMGICLGLGAGCTGTSIMVGAVGRVAAAADRPVAIAAVSIANGIGGFVGTWLSGLWGRHLEQRRGLILIYLGRSLVFVGFLVLPINAWILIGLSALLGLFWLATIPLTSGLVATFFGTTWLSTLYGTVFLGHQLGAFFGVWLGGVLFDATRSYETMWWISVALGVIAALLHGPIREAPVPRLLLSRA